jgi:hypothetical protein
MMNKIVHEPLEETALCQFITQKEYYYILVSRRWLLERERSSEEARYPRKVRE